TDRYLFQDSSRRRPSIAPRERHPREYSQVVREIRVFEAIEQLHRAPEHYRDLSRRFVHRSRSQPPNLAARIMTTRTAPMIVTSDSAAIKGSASSMSYVAGRFICVVFDDVGANRVRTDRRVRSERRGHLVVGRANAFISPPPLVCVVPLSMQTVG